MDYTAQDTKMLYRCPECQNPIQIRFTSNEVICEKCDFKISLINKIPLLSRNIKDLENYMNNVKNSLRGDWYKNSHIQQWQGPYRHHYIKRKLYVEGILKDYLKDEKTPYVGLDLGCGDGGNLEWISKYFSKMYGSDYNLERLFRARNQFDNVSLFMADVTEYPIIDNSFDVVYFNHVLEHIKDDEKALAEVYRILKPGGILILGIPNEGAFFWKLAYKLQPKYLEASDHVQFYTAKSISEKCKKVGFIIKDLKYIGWGVPHWWLDTQIRNYKWVDDLFEHVGRVLIPSQATSLYLVVSK